MGKPAVEPAVLHRLATEGIDVVFPTLNITPLKGSRAGLHIAFQGVAGITSTSEATTNTDLFVFARKLERTERATKRCITFNEDRYVGLSRDALMTLKQTGRLKAMLKAGKIVSAAQLRRKLQPALIGTDDISEAFTSDLQTLVQAMASTDETVSALNDV